jgi:hypothetical protein
MTCTNNVKQQTTKKIIVDKGGGEVQKNPWRDGMKRNWPHGLICDDNDGGGAGGVKFRQDSLTLINVLKINIKRHLRVSLCIFSKV